MRKTLRNTLAYLFEAEQDTPSGLLKINDIASIKVSARLEHKFASFSVKRNGIEKQGSMSDRVSPQEAQKRRAEEVRKNEEIEFSDADLKKIMSLVVGYMRKHKIKNATITLGKNQSAMKGIKAFRSYFEKSNEYEESDILNTSPSTFIKVRQKVSEREKAERAKEGKAPKEPKAPKERKRPQSVFDDSGENVGVKRIYKIEKDETGKVIKKYTRIFPKYATIKKLTHTLKRKNGGTVEIYNYSSRRDAGLLKKKLSYKERQYQADLANMEKVRTTPEKEVKGKQEDYVKLKRELRADVMEQLRKIKNQGVPVSEAVIKAVKGNINLSLGRFNVETDWSDYDETNKDAIVRKTVTAVRHKFAKVFK